MRYAGKQIVAVAAALLLMAGFASAQTQDTVRVDKTDREAEQSLKEQNADKQQQDEDEEEDDGSHFDRNAPVMSAEAEPHLYYIRKVNVYGVRFRDKNLLLSTSGLMPGDSLYLPSTFISDAITRLWNQRYFSDVEIGAEIEGDSIDLNVFLQERPRVRSWSFEGEHIGRSKQKDLMDELKLKAGTELSDYVIDKNEKLIKKHFISKGFRNVDVSTRIENDSIRQNMVNVTFRIDRNEKVRVGSITFSGNTQFKERRLRRTFKKTHQKSINFFQNTKLNEEDYKEDKNLLIDFYNSQGYRNATILSDSVYAINPERIGIHIDLSEGDKFYIRNIKWIGNSIYPTEELQQIFGVKSGDTYDKKSMHKRLGIGREMDPEGMSVANLYQNNGYLMSQIDELYNRALLMRTLRMLMGMGHFDAEQLQPDIQPVSSDKVNVNFPLVETASDQFNVAGGWGSGSFVGSVGITLNNLSTRNLFKKGTWTPYPMGQNQKFSISGQTNGTYYKAIAASFTDPWVGGHKPNSLTVSGHWSEQNNAYYVWQSATMYFRSFGLAAGLGKRLKWPDPNFSLYLEAQYTRYSLKNWNYFIMSNGVANELSFKVALSRSTVDQPIYPRSGSEFSAVLTLTPPYSLWDGRDYSDSSMPDRTRYKWIEYHRWQFNARWFLPISRNNKFVLMAAAEMGFLGHYNKNKVSPFERFEVGGDGMSGYTIYGVDIIRLRGYENGALDPTSDYSIGYNKYTMELRYPVILKESSQIYVLGFLEGGNGYSSWKDFSPFRIKRSAGLGVRIYLPIVGLLGLDWGWGFDAPAGSTRRSGSQFHFTMGQTF